METSGVMHSNKCQNWLMGSQGAKSHGWGIQLWGTDSKFRVTEFPVMAKVSDIQSSTQKPQQFKPIFLNTALTASEISEFSHKHLRTKNKRNKQKGDFICLQPFLSCIKLVTLNRVNAEQAWGHMCSTIRLCYDAAESEDFRLNLLMPETGLGKPHPLWTCSPSVKWG